ncbi:MAG: MBL fold metallo-hydrolase [bacterium]|nr:MBL fold metallo-hydrolase [bacterium]
MKKAFKWIGLIVLILLGIGGFVYFKYLSPFLSKMNHSEVIQLDPNITVVTGGGGNSGIIVSDSLVVVIDTKMDESSNLLYENVKELAGKRPILVINTHWHPDHVGGNKLYKGATILAGDYGKEAWIKEAGEESLPTTWLKGSRTIPMGDDTLSVFAFPKTIHSPADVMVYLRRHKVLFAGDVILNKQAPVLFGGADAYVAIMEELSKNLEIKTIVPGHGHIGGSELIPKFEQFFSDMKVAAEDPSKEDELVAKYDDWNQLPFFMSPGATVRYYRKK